MQSLTLSLQTTTKREVQKTRPKILLMNGQVHVLPNGPSAQAGIAKHGLQGFRVTPETALKITFAKQ
eukprot:1558241-Amphidinium_carterae.1